MLGLCTSQHLTLVVFDACATCQTSPLLQISVSPHVRHALELGLLLGQIWLITAVSNIGPHATDS